MSSDDGAGARATPANPMPGISVDERIPSTEGRKLPPELGPDAIAVVEGRTFMYSDGVGDVPPGTIGGLVRADTRLLSKWVLTINGARPLTVQAGLVEHYSAVFYLTNPQLPDVHPNTVSIRRLRLIGDGFRERIELQSFNDNPIELELRLSVGNDFADMFEIKDRVQDRSAQISREHAVENDRLLFRYRNNDYEVYTIVDAYPPATLIDGDDLVWQLRLTPGQQWHCELDVPLRFAPHEATPPTRAFGDQLRAPANDPVSVFRRMMPRVSAGSQLVTHVIEKSARDLLALRVAAIALREEIQLPAAGLPWFLSLFGRDSIITAYQTMSYGPDPGKGTLLALTEFQGRERNDFKDEEPGKILHEFREGELTLSRIKPHNPYYGSIDSTPLWLILLSEYWRWTGDDKLIGSLRFPALAALAWIDEYGDRDGDGFLEYQTRSPQGLGNQCWRDSWDGVQYADGTIPPLPIATCETQGYVYDAKLRLAELADGPLADPALAERLRTEAAQLRERFNEKFWIDKRGGYYALGLDGDKHHIDSLTSNIGHLLWSGIVPDDRAQAIADRLMSDELFSGWGVRTMSTLDGGYNPLGYHHGTVWPHDNSIIAAGLARYGFRDQANRITLALLDAAGYSDYQLPEALSGHPRESEAFPVRYPTACSPQAWATCAPLLCLRSMLGTTVDAQHVEIDPCIPDEIGEIVIDGLHAHGTRWHIEAIGTNGHVRLAR